jgi:hypothetical protein
MMSLVTVQAQPLVAPRPDATLAFGAAVVAFGLVAGTLSALYPVAVSVISVFVLAAPHNWMEARYALSRLPQRSGPLFGFLTLALAGVGLLTVSFAALPHAAVRYEWTAEQLTGAVTSWNAALITWVGALAVMRRRQGPHRNWPYLVPSLMAVLSAACLFPYHFGVVLVFGHPLLALVFLDRELARHRPGWVGAYRRALGVLVVASVGALWAIRPLPELDLSDPLSMAIGHHSGVTLLPALSSRFLIGCHSYLELLHFGVWVLAMPLVALGVPFTLQGIPLARRGALSRRLIALLLAALALVVVAFWISFRIDYLTTRRVYFTMAMVHVLGEVPLLLRLL